MSDTEARLRLAHEFALALEVELVDAKLELAREKRSRRKAVSRACEDRDEARRLREVLALHGIEARRLP